jgi:hypothetical protein
VSKDGATWVGLRNNLEPRNWGGDWSINEPLPASVLGTTSLFVRMRFFVESAPNSSYTVAQFGRSTSTASTNVFEINAVLQPNFIGDVNSRVVTLARIAGDGYARLVQGGIKLEQGQSYRFTTRMRGNVTLDATDHVPQFWGNGRILDGQAKRSWVRDGWTYFESTFVAPVSGTYELKLSLWSLPSVSLTDVSLKSISTGVELVRNGQFAFGLSDWYTHGGTASPA